MNKPHLAIAALGGTISMTPSDNGGITSTLGAQELIKQIPELDILAHIHAETLARIGSCSIDFSLLFRTLAWAEQQITSGADGIIISQGTDTIDQTAFFLDLYWHHPQPLVITGAMRSATELGFDGLANLYAAALTALDKESQNRGVLVVLNDSIIEARRVHKSHTTALHTFTANQQGAVGIVFENQIQYFRSTSAKPRYPIPKEHTQQVLLIEHSLDDHSAALIDYALNRPDIGGIVINGVGSGHVAAPLRDTLIIAAKTHPIIITSRTGSGSTTYRTYGYIGSEIDLQQHGILMGGWLSGVKARLLLLASLWNHDNRDALTTKLNAWSQAY